jgi:serine/threonine protein phosphatase PrpC
MYHRLFTNAHFATVTKTAILSATAFAVSDNYTNADHTKTRVVNNNTVKYSSISYNANLPCEDSFSIMYNTNQNLPFKTACAVFDGHGGRQVAKYAEKNLLKFFKSYLQLSEIEDEFGIQDHTSELENSSNKSNGSNNINSRDKNNSIETSILATFEHIENGLRLKLKPAFDLGFGSVARVGACACVAVLNNENTLTIANAGDCRAVIGSMRSNDGIIRLDSSSSIGNNNNNNLEQQQIPDSKFNSIKILNDLNDRDATSYNVKSSVSPTGTGEMTIIAKPMTSVHNACVEAEKKKLVKVCIISDNR